MSDEDIKDTIKKLLKIGSPYVFTTLNYKYEELSKIITDEEIKKILSKYLKNYTTHLKGYKEEDSLKFPEIYFYLYKHGYTFDKFDGTRSFWFKHHTKEPYSGGHCNVNGYTKLSDVVDYVERMEKLNEGVRDKMLPKSEEDIKKSLISLLPFDRIQKIHQYKAENMFTNEELKQFINDLSSSVQLEYMLKYQYLFTEEEIEQSVQNTTAEIKIKLGIINNIPELVEDALKQPGQAWRWYYPQIMKYACTYGLTNIVKFMIDTKMSAIYIKEYLYLACVNNHIEVLKLLLDAGFNPFVILNDEELLPTIKNKEVIKLLKQYD